MNNNETTIQQWTIVFRIKENNLLYNDNKDSVLFSINPEWWSIFMNKDERNFLNVAYVVIWKWRIDLFHNVSKLDSKRAHMFAFTWNINGKISLYIDWDLVEEKNVEFDNL